MHRHYLLLSVATIVLGTVGFWYARTVPGWLPTPLTMNRIYHVLPPDPSSHSVAVFRPAPDGADIVALWTNAFNSPNRHYRYNIVLYDHGLRLVNQVNMTRPIQWVGGLPVDDKPGDELLISYGDETAAGLQVRKYPSLDTISQFEFDAHSWSDHVSHQFDNHILPLHVTLTAHSNQPRLISSVLSGKGGIPRGLLILDPRTGTEICHSWVAGSILEVVLVPGLPGQDSIIVFGTYGAANGVVWQNTRDDRAYMGAIDGAGTCLWIKEFPGPFSQISVLPESSSHGEIWALYSFINDPAGSPLLMRVNGQTGQMMSSTTLDRCQGIGRLSRFSSPRHGALLLISADRGAWLVRDKEGSRLPLLDNMLSVSACGDFNVDGHPEMLVVGRDKSLQLLDKNLRLLAVSHNVDAGPSYTQRIPGEPWPLIWTQTAEGVDVFRITSRSWYYPIWLLWLLGIYGGSAALVFGTHGAIELRRAVVRSSRERERNEAWAMMASKLAHDIRTPLSVLRLSGQNLEMELEAALGGIPHSLLPYFETIARESDRMNRVAQGFMKFARVAPPSLEPMDLGQLVKETVERSTHSSEVELTCQVETQLPVVLVDHQQMVSMLENLMSNSLKAIRGTGEILIRVHRAQELLGKGKVRHLIELQVEDSGSGIPPDHMPKVFEPYFSHSEGGTGLGLAIVKKAVEDHNGTIRIESTVGTGTTVTVRIPLRTEVPDGD